MTPTDEQASAAFANRALLPLMVVVTLALGWILLPFYGAIMWGAIIAMLFTPVYRRLLARLKWRRTRAALVTMLLILLVLILPFALLTAALAREATQVYQQLQSGEMNPSVYFQGVFDTLPDWLTALLDRFGLVNFAALQRRLADGLALGSQFLATQALGIGQLTFEFVTSLFITLYLSFFLIRDGDSVARALRDAVPLAPEHKKELIGKFTTVIRATVKGNLLVALIQGTLGGLAFWALGVGGALLWAVLMAFLSLLPAIGAGLVWVPVAAYFFVTGFLWQAIALVAWGVLVIGLIDNLLRPILVGKDTRMPDYVVMITTLGGMVVFGINGFVIGPAIAAMFMAVWHIYAVTRIEAAP
ncbi:MAG: AI-2E family transporter [Gammaproteobacteria bacterium]|uniref:AI-2E family transporter n=1 Tax=Rhodoferax sp. TaxID=50421 RepID=UPI0017B2159B|nr:AI-2E family transporter [Rhodoferax sp.]MBU3900841.1 AI-2E family transporter [Gammaproteobacteria bacterium]MBA3060006.1 AI-2E family transporter [Rhodoferax sp.]MBU3996603.1 AI-2E family transporter [Gammaproteobacteria bacterium]MBU4079592.1 AI-2E family transporter [Gammaproteobacteria bacterium]MBU4112230.1 AI-2E family transporter [Gammaproteobacteria bacterium]